MRNKPNRGRTAGWILGLGLLLGGGLYVRHRLRNSPFAEAVSLLQWQMARRGRMAGSVEDLETRLRRLPRGNVRLLNKWLRARAENDSFMLQRLVPVLELTLLPSLAADPELRPIYSLVFTPASHDQPV